MCSIELDPCDVWREEERKARKEHRCDCCCGPIKPGTKYLSHFSVFEGDACHEKLCSDCKDDRKVFADEHGQYMTPSSFDTMLNDCIYEGDEGSAKWEQMQKRIRERRPTA